MYVVIEVGAKQYLVKEGDLIETEKQEVEPGKELLIDKVLLAVKDDQFKVGQPSLKKVKVKAEVVAHFKDKKKISFKYRRRKSSHWKKGHRQLLTRLKIKEIKWED